MSHDLIIFGGSVIDGTGTEAKKADVAVDGDRITRIGDLTGTEAARTIDATGKVVTPGFVDLHTHLDAQVGWDPEMKSSSYHGVTTALIGNCGVTFAPVGKQNHRMLAELMEAVEDIAADAIMDGLPWDWPATRRSASRRWATNRWTKACRPPMKNSITSVASCASRSSRAPSVSRVRAFSVTSSPMAV